MYKAHSVIPFGFCAAACVVGFAEVEGARPAGRGGKGEIAAETLRTIVAVTSAYDVADAAGVAVHLGGSPGSLKEGVSRKGEEQGAVTSCC